MARDAGPAAPARPLRRDAELNRRRILASAREVFGRRGLEATLDDIAHHAGLGVGTVYRRFPSKEHLVEAMFAERMEEIGKLAEEALKADDAWQAFVDFTWQAAELHSADRGLREIMLSNRFGHEHVAEEKARMVPLITRLVERAKAAGGLRSDFAPTDIPLLHMMVGSVVEFTAAVDPQLWRRCLAMLLDGLRAEPGKATELPHPPLEAEEVDEAMSCWRP
jgi:AcrR family transcriptional regulator